MKLLVFILIFFASLQLCCQSIDIKGVVLDGNNGEALPFAHLYSPNNFGTIANDSGQFLIRIDSNAINDTMFVQSLAYEKRKIAIAELVAQPNSVLKLKKKSYPLDQVEISPKDESVELGPNYNRKKCKSYIPLALYPFQIGIVIDVPYQGRLDKVKCRISKHGSSWFKSAFRLRVYSYDTLNNTPSKELAQNNIITRLKSRSGWLTVDVKSEKIELNNQKIFVAIETVKEGKVIGSEKVNTPEGEITVKNYDMEIVKCFDHYDDVKFQKYIKNYERDQWESFLASPKDSIKSYPLIKVEVLK